MARPKRNVNSAEPVSPKVDDVEESQELEETPQVPATLIKVTRDSEGRIVLEIDSLPKRIAGSDDALPETLRQLGHDILSRKLV